MNETIYRVRPTPVDTYLGNPHKGCCTFQHFNGDPLFPGRGWSEEGPVEFPSLAAIPETDGVGRQRVPRAVEGYLPTTVSYCRWFWEKLEPEPGKYDFSVVENSLEVCKQRGQTLAVRLMAFGSFRQPQLPTWYLKKYPTTAREHKSAKMLYPDHNSKEYLDQWGNLLREFGRRFDGHAFLETVDLAYIGPWGEGDGEISYAQCVRFTKVYQEAHHQTPLMVNLDNLQFKAAIDCGVFGWRCDCYGDLRAGGTPQVRKDLAWNHHCDAYPQAVIQAGATDAWKKGPVHFEACGVPMDWYLQGYDLDFILQQGLKFHGTYFMSKYTKLPEPWMEQLAAFCRKLGYRFMLRQALIQEQVKAGGDFRFECWIENTGVAPLYRKYDLALRLRQGDREEIVTLPEQDVHTWLPGDNGSTPKAKSA